MYENAKINIYIKQIYTGLLSKTQSKHVINGHKAILLYVYCFYPICICFATTIKVFKLHYSNHVLLLCLKTFIV